ncbi:hypothetical protein H310_06202 [Aphanomyces invadans]|uniref:Uncharacterized protein n=1 Tax=Aphanomyces invadans TaxID=157072 RepID=A0A024U6N1_9STRA|nr:hypothetical protein H310_06202 [Aphanomyces invadans]ETW01547.1 hypothetical protein H310_06202 [Aphanomyces invadans]|eukprot:XP_008869395.1 hypothetical protein H310_06202 [Aphanomyces invadans]
MQQNLMWGVSGLAVRLVLVTAAVAMVVDSLLHRLYARTDRGKVYMLTAVDGGNWTEWSCPYGFGVRHVIGTANDRDLNVMFAVGPDRHVYQMQEDAESRTWHEWQSLSGVSHVTKLASSRDVAGSWRVYAITTSHKLAVTSRDALGWWTFDGDVIDAVATADADGNHQVMSIMANGTMWESTEVRGVWSTWNVLQPSQVENDPTFRTISIGTSRDGYRCVCGVSAVDSSVWARLETPNGWLPWKHLENEAVHVGVVRGIDNTFVLVILDSNQYLLVATLETVRSAASVGVTSWSPIASHVQTFELSSMPRATAVNTLFFLDLHGSLWTMDQESTGDWTTATSAAPSSRLRQLAQTPSPRLLPVDGRSPVYDSVLVVQELFGLTSNSTAYRRVQDIFGTWSDWALYATNVSQLVSGPKSGQVYVRDLDGMAYRMMETGMGRFVRRIPLGSTRVAKIEQCYMPYSMTSLVFGLEDGTGRILESDSASTSLGWPQWVPLPPAPTPCRDFSVAPNVYFGLSVFCLTTTGIVYELAKDDMASEWSPSGWVGVPYQFQGAPDVESVPPLVQIEAIQGTQVGLIGRDVTNKLWALLQHLDGTWADFWYPNMLSGSSSQIAVKVDWQGYIAVYFTSSDGMSFREQKQSSPDSFDAGTQLPIPIEAFATTSDMSGLNQLFLSQSSGKTSGFVKTVDGTWDLIVSFADVNHFTALVATESTRVPGSQEAYVVFENRTACRLVRDFRGKWESEWHVWIDNVKQIIPGATPSDAVALDMEGMVYAIKGGGAVRQPLGIATMDKILATRSLLFAIDATSSALKEWTVGDDGMFRFEWRAVPSAIRCVDIAATPDAIDQAAIFCVDAITNTLKHATKSFHVDGTWTGPWTTIGGSTGARSWQSIAAAMSRSGSLVVFAQDVSDGFLYMLQQNGPRGSWPMTWTLVLPQRVASFTPVASASGSLSVIALTSSVLVNVDVDSAGEVALAMPQTSTTAFTVAQDPSQQPQLFCVDMATGRIHVTLPAVAASRTETLPPLDNATIVAIFATVQANVVPSSG